LKKIAISAILATMTITSLSANDGVVIQKTQKNSSTYNEVDDKYKASSGFAFYQDSNTSKRMHLTQKCNCKKIMEDLDEIKRQAKLQTEIQRKILAILQKTLDPQPKVITVNGKKCIANSSADCFQMPITPAAQRVPALKKWMENPTLQNTVNYLQWQAKYFKEIFKRADSLPMAINQFGAQAYPLSTKSLGYINAFGDNTREKVIDNIINGLNKDYKFIVFLGDNRDLDTISIFTLKELIKKYKKLDFEIVFKNKKSKEYFNSVIETLYSKKGQEIFKKTKKIVSDSLFEKLHIYTTPSILIVNTKDKKAQIIMSGKISNSNFARNVFNYLEYNGKIDESKFFNYNRWKNAKINQHSDFYQNIYSIEFDKLLKEHMKKKKENK